MKNNYIAPRGVGFEAHLQDWIKNAERRFEAKQLAGRGSMLAEGADVEFAIMDVIGSFWADEYITAARVQRELKRFPNAKKIRVLINSPGGVCSEGVAIYNLFKMHPAEFEVVVIGEAASAASVIAMAGDRVVMRTGTWMMVHRAACCACGFDTDMLEAASYLKTLTEGAIDIYEKRTSLERGQLTSMLHETTWMSTQQAIEFGFADAIDDGDAVPATAADEDDPEPQQLDIKFRVSTNHATRVLPELASMKRTMRPTFGVFR